MENFEILFAEQYGVIHRLETNKLRNVAKVSENLIRLVGFFQFSLKITFLFMISQLFAHFLHSDALPWTVLSNIRLSEDSTTSSSRIFIKILFQELVEYLGLQKLNLRLKDEYVTYWIVSSYSLAKQFLPVTEHWHLSLKASSQETIRKTQDLLSIFLLRLV